MYQVTIKPQWAIRRSDGDAVPARVIELLVQVGSDGSLSAACARLGVSYRHAWDLIRQAEALFGEPLVVMERGKGSNLTQLGEKLVWADRRINARLSPALDSLASELVAEIEKVLSPQAPILRLHANHGFAVETLRPFLSAADVRTEVKYCGSVEAVAALHEGACDIAGFPVPVGEFEATVLEHYRHWLNEQTQMLIHISTRRQGFMVAAGNPKKIYDTRDLARPGVRFINRQPGSGTRLLLDLMLHKDGIAHDLVSGYEQCELTHSAVAAFVASGMADVAFGVETPARRFKLDFIPHQMERYFFLCGERALASPAVQTLLAILSSTEYRSAVNLLPGYQADAAGQVVRLNEAFEALSR